MSHPAAGADLATAIIVAAGTSQRMGFDKLFADLAGRPVVAWSISAFQSCEAIGDIVLVTRSEKATQFREMAQKWGWTKLRTILPGGAQRHLSVWNGLRQITAGLNASGSTAAGPHFVAVHDGARPLVTPGMIARCLELARGVGAACCAAPVSDTLKRADAEGRICGGVERANLWAMQTPQIFDLASLVEAYRMILETGAIVTDETSAFERIGRPVALLNSGDFNLKITYPPDIELARHLLTMRASS